jgi:hypothetical protein
LFLTYTRRLGFFGVVEPTAENLPSRDFTDTADNSNRGGWSHLVASLEERLASGRGTTQGTAEEMEYLTNNPAIAAAFDNTTCLKDDYLTMRPSKDPPELGKWVQVRRGTYKGDVGYVLSVGASEVHLLLIPRLPLMDQPHSKRKRTGTRPTSLKLFDHETFTQEYAIQSHRIQENIYSVGNDRFEHGLIVRSYRFNSVSTGVSTIPLASFSHFCGSRHPKFSRKTRFPRPLEWIFAESEKVYIVDDSSPPSYKSGPISTLRDDSAEVETDEGTVIVPWVAICKVINVGDFVEVTGGSQKEQRGWVDEVDLRTRLANVISLVDGERPISDYPEVRRITNIHLMPLFPSDFRGALQSIKACCCSLCAWTASKVRRCDCTFAAASMDRR